MESSFGVGGPVLSWIRSFLQGRTQQVYSGGKASNVVTVTFGVPQVRVLGPIFFILYTTDIPLIAKEFNLNVHCYVDDGQLYSHERASSVVANFSACIVEIERWMTFNRLKLNPDKPSSSGWVHGRSLPKQTQVQLVLVHPHWDANQPSITLESPSTAS